MAPSGPWLWQLTKHRKFVHKDKGQKREQKVIKDSPGGVYKLSLLSVADQNNPTLLLKHILQTTKQMLTINRHANEMNCGPDRINKNNNKEPLKKK